MAVRVGFEPTEPVKAQRFSRPPDSTTLAPHRGGLITGHYTDTTQRRGRIGSPCALADSHRGIPAGPFRTEQESSRKRDPSRLPCRRTPVVLQGRHGGSSTARCYHALSDRSARTKTFNVRPLCGGLLTGG